MNFFLQTCSPDEFMEVNQAVTLSGIVLDAHALAAKESDVKQCITDLLEVMSKEQKLYIPCISIGFRSILEEGKKLTKLSDQIVMVTGCDGPSFMAMKACHTLKIPVAMGRIFQSEQAILAANNNPEKLIFNFEEISRLSSPEKVLASAAKSLPESRRELLMASGVDTPDQLEKAAQAGVENICCTVGLYRTLLYNPLSQESAQALRDDWMMAYTREELLD